jgi:DHA3 family macrolide efflux protein-like MFS transporter
VGPSPESPAFGHSLRVPAFRRLFSSATTSTLGAAISLVSVNWIVYHYTGSAVDIAYVGLTGIVPGIVLGLFAGVVADRYNRRSLMITADLARMGGMGVLAVVLLVSGFSLLWVLATMILVNSFSALFTPASQAILPRLISKPSLVDANGILQSSVGAAWSIGSAIGGVLVVLVGAVWGLGVNALTYGLSAIFLFQIAGSLGQQERQPAGPPPSFAKEFREGLGYVVRNRPILEVSFGYLPVNFLSSLVTPFFVVYAANRFGGDAAIFGGLAAALAAGIAVGSLSVGRTPAHRQPGVAMGLGLLIEAGAAALLAFSHLVAISLAAAFIWGVSIGFANTIYYATMQRVVPGELLGRVLSIGDFGSFVAIPAGLVVGAILIEVLGVGNSYLFAAGGLLLTAIALLALPEFRRFGTTS